jgi:hypothetical protein
MRYMIALTARDQSQFWKIGRLWQLTDTRYILGMKPFLELMNQQVDPKNHSFAVKTSFDFTPRAGTGSGSTPEEITTVIRPEGQFAIFEFGAALPKAKMYSTWDVIADDKDTLQKLEDPAFDPLSRVLVTNPHPGFQLDDEQPPGDGDPHDVRPQTGGPAGRSARCLSLAA